MTTTDPFEEPLSPGGATRQEQIRRLALRAAAGRRWRRRAGHGLIVVAALVAAGTPLLYFRSSPPIAAVPRPVIAPPHPHVAITFVETDPTITERWSVRPRAPRWQPIDDRQLLDALAAANRPGQLQTINGEERVVFFGEPPR